ncbi:MAG: glutathione peroxidase [Nannocystaceae bacterium]
MGGCEGKTTGATAPAATAAAPSATAKAAGRFTPNDTVIDHEVTTLDGKPKRLSEYRGKALLLVNTASECGYTPQYAGLQQLYAKYRARGLEVLAFPSDDFGHQEPGTPEQIREFVDQKFAVEFPMFDKLHATGPQVAPLYKALTEQTGEGIRGAVKWNFTKFLVDPSGRVVARFEPEVEPDDAALVGAIEQVLPPA